MEAWQPFLAEAYEANWFTNFGALSRRLECKLAERWGFADTACIAASSGTVALAAPLIVRGVTGPVLTPAFTFPATASAIKMAGAKPALVDVDLQTWRVTPQILDAAFARTGAKAAIVVCPFGLKSDWSAHIEIARAHGAILIIDNAAGLGVTRENVERSPDVFEIYSLHATKPFGIGEGGAIFAHRDNADLLRSAMNFGLPWRTGKPNTAWGVNGKLSELHAAVGLAVEQTFDQRLALRRQMVAGYMERLAPHRHIHFPTAVDESCWQLFPTLMPSESAVERVVELAGCEGWRCVDTIAPPCLPCPVLAANGVLSRRIWRGEWFAFQSIRSRPRLSNEICLRSRIWLWRTCFADSRVSHPSVADAIVLSSSSVLRALVAPPRWTLRGCVAYLGRG